MQQGDLDLRPFQFHIKTGPSVCHDTNILSVNICIMSLPALSHITETRKPKIA